MRGLGYMTVSEMLDKMHENYPFDMFPGFSNVVYMSLQCYLLHRVLQNDQSVRCAD